MNISWNELSIICICEILDCIKCNIPSRINHTHVKLTLIFDLNFIELNNKKYPVNPKITRLEVNIIVAKPQLLIRTVNIISVHTTKRRLTVVSPPGSSEV
jgi:hypothetical protein